MKNRGLRPHQQPNVSKSRPRKQLPHRISTPAFPLVFQPLILSALLVALFTFSFRAIAYAQESQSPLQSQSEEGVGEEPDSGSVASDRAALTSFYAATDGENWEQNTNWLSDKPLQSWFGVITDTQGRVIGISLDGNGLEGTIPVQLGTLSQLGSLSLADNKLQGQIPAELGNLSSLVTIFLGGNQLSGPIPSQLGSLASLQILSVPGVIENAGDDATGNVLSGPIPPELGNLTNLGTLDLQGNELSGPIPLELGNLTSMLWLHLDGNQLTGPIPTELGNLTDLESLSLSGNQLTGGIPVVIGSLSNLKVLHLWGNQLTGSIPVELGSLTNLTALALSENSLGGTIPTVLGNLVLLESLYLWGNQLTGALPPDLANLLALDWLFLSQNPLTGCIPAVLNEVSSNDLAELNLPECAESVPVTSPVIEDSNPTATPDNTTPGSDRAALEALFASTNGNFWIDSDNWLSGQALGEWYGVTTDSQGRVTKMVLDGNRLTGTIPPELGALSKLLTLNLADNELTGHIPAELGSLSLLTTMDLDHNLLSGPIPPELGNLGNLQTLSIRGIQEEEGDDDDEIGNHLRRTDSGRIGQPYRSVYTGSWGE